MMLDQTTYALRGICADLLAAAPATPEDARATLCDLLQERGLMIVWTIDMQELAGFAAQIAGNVEEIRAEWQDR